jgi:hypothetical protein
MAATGGAAATGTSCFEHGNEPSCFIKDWEFWLNDFLASQGLLFPGVSLIDTHFSKQMKEHCCMIIWIYYSFV